MQTAAEAALLQKNGLSDYTCAGCDPALTAAIDADGGPSAFASQIAGLSTDPSTYASLDTGAGLADFFAQQPGITVTADPSGDGTIASAAAAAGVTGSAGSSFHPFSWLWNQYQAGVAAPLAAELASVQGMVAGPLTALLSLSVMVIALGAYAGRFAMTDFYNRVIRIAFVVALSGVGSTYYNQYVVQFFGGLPTWFSNNILGAVSTNPAAGFDIVLHNFGATVSNTWWSLPWGVASLFLDGAIIAICFLIVMGALGLMFTVWLIAQALLQLLIVLGPLLVLALLFDHTRGWFDRWISAMALMVFVTLAADMVSSIVLLVITGAMAALPQINDTAQTTQNVFNIVGIALVVFVLSAAVGILPRMLQHIAAASGAPAMDHAHGLLGAGANAATRGAGRAIGALTKVPG